MKYTIYQTKSAYETATNELNQISGRVEHLLHSMAMSALIHASNGTFDYLDDFVETLKGRRLYKGEAFIDWICHFGKVKFDQDSGKFITKKRGKWNIDNAAEKPFWIYSSKGDIKPKMPEINKIKAVAAVAMAKMVEAGDYDVDDLISALNSGLADMVDEKRYDDNVVDFVEKYEAAKNKTA